MGVFSWSKARKSTDKAELACSARSFGLFTGLALAFSLSFFFLVLSYDQFFFISPFRGSNDLRMVLLSSYLLAWPLYMLLPPIAALLRLRNLPNRVAMHTAMFSVGIILWPLTTLLIKVENATRGVYSVRYWLETPSYVLYEVVWPLLGLLGWKLLSDIRGETSKKVQRRIDHLLEGQGPGADRRDPLRPAQ